MLAILYHIVAISCLPHVPRLCYNQVYLSGCLFIAEFMHHADNLLSSLFDWYFTYRAVHPVYTLSVGKSVNHVVCLSEIPSLP
jgi:hypothetical protein